MKYMYIDKYSQFNGHMDQDMGDVIQHVPNLYESKENCCGCSACFAICPVRAITMKADEEGFLYPMIDAETCICCYRCISVCVFKSDQEKKGYYIRRKGDEV